MVIEIVHRIVMVTIIFFFFVGIVNALRKKIYIFIKGVFSK